MAARYGRQLMEPQDAAKLIIERRNARVSVPDYIRYMRPEHLPDFHHTPAKHHRIFAAVLDVLSRSLREQLEKDDRAAISVPPGSAKSFYYSIVWPTHLLAMNPSWKIICVSAAESLAEDFARRRRQIMLSKRWCALSGTQLSKDARGLSFQGTPQGGGIYAYGAGSTIQGIRADALVADDLVTGHEEAGNLAQLDKKWSWYTSEARPRLRPYGVEALIATRWALLDPIGRVLRLTDQGHEKWRYLRIPMIADDANDPVGREIGERLWPEYFTRRMVQDAQRNPLVWQTLYQQNPAVSEHSWVPLDNIHIIQRSELPEHLTYYIGIDISLGVQRGDHTVFAIVGVDENKQFYLVDLYRAQGDPAKTCSAFLGYWAQYKDKGLKYAWIDNDNASIIWKQLVEQAASAQGLHPTVLISKMKNRDKEVRAAPLRNLFVQNRVKIVDDVWTHLALREIAEFPGGTDSPDIIDAFGLPAKELRKITGPVIATPVEKKPIVGQFQYQDGKIMTTQPLKEMATLNIGGRRGRI